MGQENQFGSLGSKHQSPHIMRGHPHREAPPAPSKKTHLGRCWQGLAPGLSEGGSVQSRAAERLHTPGLASQGRAPRSIHCYPLDQAQRLRELSGDTRCTSWVGGTEIHSQAPPCPRAPRKVREAWTAGRKDGGRLARAPVPGLHLHVETWPQETFVHALAPGGPRGGFTLLGPLLLRTPFKATTKAHGP